MVVVGLAVNLFSNYLYIRSGEFLRGASTGWRRASERARERRTKLVEKLRNDDSARKLLHDQLLEYRHDEIMLYLWALASLLMCLLGAIVRVLSESLMWTFAIRIGFGITLIRSLCHLLQDGEATMCAICLRK